MICRVANVMMSNLNSKTNQECKEKRNKEMPCYNKKKVKDLYDRGT